MELEFLHSLQSIHNDILNDVMMFITSLGDGGFLWILISIMLIIIPSFGKENVEQKKKRRNQGFLVLAALVVNAIIVNLFIKNIVQRPRPFQVDTSVIPLFYPKEYSFPSGHASSSFAAATMLLFYNRKWGIVAFIMAGLIAFSRMYFFVHYPTDILGGCICGIFCATFVWYGQKRLFKK